MRGWIWILGCSFAALALAGPCAAQDARAASDATFREQLAALATKCDELKLPEQARQTRAWSIERDPRRQYLFLPAVRTDAPLATASDLEGKWQSKFLEIRRAQAARLFDLAKREVTEGSATTAFQLLHEALREDPTHAAVLRILSSSAEEDSPPRARQPPFVQAQFAWKRGSWTQVDTSHFQILTDAHQQDGLELARQLEDFHAVWRQMFFEYWNGRDWLAERFAGKSPRWPSERKHQVVLFRDREEYVRQLGKAEPQIAVTLGYYHKRNQTSYFFAGEGAALAVWFHEAAHQLFQESGTPIRDVGEQRNFWVVEGVAVYLESATRYDGYLTVGGWDADRLQFVRARSRGGEPLVPLDQLARLGRESLQQHPDIRKLYTHAAGLTHYLMDGHAGRDRAAFVRGLIDLYRGKDTPASFISLPCFAPETFDRDWSAFLSVTGDDLRLLGPVEQRRNLSLAGATIRDADCHWLAGSESLEWLDLSYVPISDAGFAQLGKLKNLQRLSLVNTRITDESAAAIAALPKLEDLDLSGTRISDEGLRQLVSARSLKFLRLVLTSVTDAGLEHLTALAKLEELDVAQTAVTEAAVQQLRLRLPNLKP